MDHIEREETHDHDGDTEETPVSGDEKENEREVEDIWESWKTLLTTIKASTVSPALRCS